LRMSEGMKPTDPVRNIWHMEPGDARPDASPEPHPLIAPGSVVGLWLVEHLPVVHVHDHAFYEMALVLSGSGFHVCGDSEEPVQAGTVVFVPPGVAHGYLALTDLDVIYWVTSEYDPSDEHGVAWNDPTLAIPWRIDTEPVVSERDAGNPKLDWELVPEFS